MVNGLVGEVEIDLINKYLCRFGVVCPIEGVLNVDMVMAKAIADSKRKPYSWLW